MATEVEIQVKAKRVNYVSRLCPFCKGSLRIPDPNAQTTPARLTSSCETCAGKGRVWYPAEDAPTPELPDLLGVEPMSDAKLMTLPEP